MSNEKYKEILKLHEMMVKADIPHSFHEVFGGYQIHYPNSGGELVCSYHCFRKSEREYLEKIRHKRRKA